MRALTWTLLPLLVYLPTSLAVCEVSQSTSDPRELSHLFQLTVSQGKPWYKSLYKWPVLDGLDRGFCV